VTERRNASAGDGWDADVLETDATGLSGATETRGTTARPLGTLPDDADALSELETDSDEPEVEALVVEIAETRADMADTMTELGDRLDPANIADRAKERVREATIGTLETKVDEMTTAASEFATDTGRTAQEVGTGLVETIKRNPIPAAMAGIGIGWLVMNRQSGSRALTDRRWTSDDSWMASGSYDRGGSQGNGLSRGASQIGDTVGDAAQQARRTASEAASTVGDTASQAATTVQRTASDVVGDAQRAIESNPLAFGAIAVAVGAAVGMAIPSTQTEKRIMGQTGSQLIDKAANAVERPLEKIENAGSR
jgi:ElaB/YqjD/DUF883 family membrane-anchored ribosome-binding protein